MPLSERADRRLADGGERLGKQVVELLAIDEALPKDLGLPLQLVVAQRGNIWLEAVDRLDIFAQATDITIVGRSEDALCHCGEHVNSLENPHVTEERNSSRRRYGKLRPAM